MRLVENTVGCEVDDLVAGQFWTLSVGLAGLEAQSGQRLSRRGEPEDIVGLLTGLRQTLDAGSSGRRFHKHAGLELRRTYAGGPGCLARESLIIQIEDRVSKYGHNFCRPLAARNLTPQCRNCRCRWFGDDLMV